MNATDPKAIGNGVSPAVGGHYEFDEAQNFVFSQLASAMKFVGIVQLVLAVIQLIGAVLNGIAGNISGVIAGLTQAVFLGLIGIWTINASKHVMSIVSTEGNDVAHLMSAMSELRKLYSFQRIVFILMVVLMLAAFIVGIVLAIG